MDTTKKIDETQSLTKVLNAMKIGECVRVEDIYYTEIQVRQTASRMNQTGRTYKVSNKHAKGECMVKRIN